MADDKREPGKIYENDIGTAIILRLSPDDRPPINITGASNTKMLVLKPNRTRAEWVAEILTVNGATKYLRHFTVDGDLVPHGRFRIMAYLSVAGWTGPGETGSFKVWPYFK